MKAMHEQRSHPSIQYLFYVTLGVTIGLILLISLYHPSRWTWFIVAGMTVPWLIILTPHPKLTLLFILVLTVPLNTDLILNYRLHPGGAKGWTFSLIDIPLVVLYAIWLWEKISDPSKRTKWLNGITVPLSIFIFIGIVSLINAKDLHLGLFQIFVLSKKLLLVIYISNNIGNEKTLKWILLALLFGFLFECSVGLLQYLTQSKVGLYLLGELKDDVASMDLIGYKDITRVSGTFWHSNGFAFYLQLLIPLFLAFSIVRSNGICRLLSGSIALFGFIILLLTLSRGAWVSFIVSIVVLLILFLKKLNNKAEIIKWVILSLIIFSVMIFFFGELISVRLFGHDYGAAYSRIPMMKTALNIIGHNPLLGIGINNYAESMIDYDVTGHSFSLYRPVHNLFLLIAAETGLLGLLFFLWLLVRAILMGLKMLQSFKGTDASIVIGIIAGLIGFIIHAQVDFVLLDYMNIFWLYLGIISGMFYSSYFSQVKSA